VKVAALAEDTVPTVHAILLELVANVGTNVAPFVMVPIDVPDVPLAAEPFTTSAVFRAPVAPDGLAISTAETVTVSPDATVDAKVPGTAIVTVWVVVAGVEAIVPKVNGASPTPAVAGATEVKTPKPREATATSATRLKVVFVDICFLSISRSEESPPLGFG